MTSTLTNISGGASLNAQDDINIGTAAVGLLHWRLNDDETLCVARVLALNLERARK